VSRFVDCDEAPPPGRLVDPCDCGDCLSCELRGLRARYQGETVEDVLERDRADYRVAVRAAESMAGVL